MLNYANEKGVIREISDLKKYIKCTNNISHIGKPINDGVELFLKNHLQNYLKEMFQNKKIKVPKNFE